MFIINRRHDIKDEIIYNSKNIIGVFDNMIGTKNALLNKLSQLKYELDIQCDDDNYFFCCYNKKK